MAGENDNVAVFDGYVLNQGGRELAFLSLTMDKYAKLCERQIALAPFWGDKFGGLQRGNILKDSSSVTAVIKLSNHYRKKKNSSVYSQREEKTSTGLAPNAITLFIDEKARKDIVRSKVESEEDFEAEKSSTEPNKIKIVRFGKRIAVVIHLDYRKDEDAIDKPIKLMEGTGFEIDEGEFRKQGAENAYGFGLEDFFKNGYSMFKDEKGEKKNFPALQVIDGMTRSMAIRLVDLREQEKKSRDFDMSSFDLSFYIPVPEEREVTSLERHSEKVQVFIELNSNKQVPHKHVIKVSDKTSRWKDDMKSFKSSQKELLEGGDYEEIYTKDWRPFSDIEDPSIPIWDEETWVVSKDWYSKYRDTKPSWDEMEKKDRPKRLLQEGKKELTKVDINDLCSRVVEMLHNKETSPLRSHFKQPQSLSKKLYWYNTKDGQRVEVPDKLVERRLTPKQKDILENTGENAYDNAKEYLDKIYPEMSEEDRKKEFEDGNVELKSESSFKIAELTFAKQLMNAPSGVTNTTLINYFASTIGKEDGSFDFLYKNVENFWTAVSQLIHKADEDTGKLQDSFTDKSIRDTIAVGNAGLYILNRAFAKIIFNLTNRKGVSRAMEEGDWSVDFYREILQSLRLSSDFDNIAHKEIYTNADGTKSRWLDELVWKRSVEVPEETYDKLSNGNGQKAMEQLFSEKKIKLKKNGKEKYVMQGYVTIGGSSYGKYADLWASMENAIDGYFKEDKN